MDHHRTPCLGQFPAIAFVVCCDTSLYGPGAHPDNTTRPTTRGANHWATRRRAAEGRHRCAGARLTLRFVTTPLTQTTPRALPYALSLDFAPSFPPTLAWRITTPDQTAISLFTRSSSLTFLPRHFHNQQNVVSLSSCLLQVRRPRSPRRGLLLASQALLQLYVPSLDRDWTRANHPMQASSRVSSDRASHS